MSHYQQRQVRKTKTSTQLLSRSVSRSHCTIDIENVELGSLQDLALPPKSIYVTDLSKFGKCIVLYEVDVL